MTTLCPRRCGCISANTACTWTEEYPAIEALEISQRARAALEAKKGIDPLLLDLRGLSSVSDFFLIVSGTSAPHLRALVEETEKALRLDGARSYRRSGTPESGWVVLDYVDVVIHCFTAEARRYYGLEQLWKDAGVVS